MNSDEVSAVIEYAANLDAIWHAPHADTAVGLATHHMTLDRGFGLLRKALADYYASVPAPPTGEPTKEED